MIGLFKVETEFDESSNFSYLDQKILYSENSPKKNENKKEKKNEKKFSSEKIEILNSNLNIIKKTDKKVKNIYENFCKRKKNLEKENKNIIEEEILKKEKKIKKIFYDEKKKNLKNDLKNEIKNEIINEIFKKEKKMKKIEENNYNFTDEEFLRESEIFLNVIKNEKKKNFEIKKKKENFENSEIKIEILNSNSDENKKKRSFKEMKFLSPEDIEKNPNSCKRIFSELVNSKETKSLLFNVKDNCYKIQDNIFNMKFENFQNEKKKKILKMKI